MRRGTTVEDTEMVAALENNTSLIGLSYMMNPNQQNENFYTSMLNLSSNMLAQANQQNNMSQIENDRSLIDLNQNNGIKTPRGDRFQIDNNQAETQPMDNNQGEMLFALGSSDKPLFALGSSDKPIEGAANQDNRSFGSDGNRIIPEMEEPNFVEVQNESLMKELDEGFEPDEDSIPQGQNVFAASWSPMAAGQIIEKDF